MGSCQCQRSCVRSRALSIRSNEKRTLSLIRYCAVCRSHRREGTRVRKQRTGNDGATRGALLSPPSISPTRETAVTTALQDAGVNFSGFQNVLTVQGERHRISRDTMRAMTAAYRELIDQYGTPTVRDPEFMALPTDVRHRVLSGQLGKLRDITRMRVGLPTLETSAEDKSEDQL